MKKQAILTIVAAFMLLFAGFAVNVQAIDVDSLIKQIVPQVSEIAKAENKKASSSFPTTEEKKAIIAQAKKERIALDKLRAERRAEDIQMFITVGLLGLLFVLVVVFWKQISSLWKKKQPAVQQPSPATATQVPQQQQTSGTTQKNFKWFFGKIFHAIEHWYTHGLTLFFVVNDKLDELMKEPDLNLRYKKAKKLCKEYIVSLATLSGIIIVLVFGPWWFGIVGKLTSYIPIYIPETDVNVAVLLVKIFAGLVIAYWVLTFMVGRERVRPGYAGWVLINGKFAFPKPAGSGAILTFPIFGFNFIELRESPTIISVECILGTRGKSSDPFMKAPIITASKKTAMSLGGSNSSKCKGDILHTTKHLMMSRGDFNAEFTLIDQKQLFSTFGDDIDRLEKVLKNICAGARQQCCQEQSGGQINALPGDLCDKVLGVINDELTKLKCGYKITNFLFCGINFSCELERGDNSGLIKRGFKEVDTITA